MAAAITAQEVYVIFKGDASKQQAVLRKIEEYDAVKTFLDNFEARGLFSHSHHQHPSSDQGRAKLESKLKQNEQPRKKFVLALGDALKLDELKANEVLTSFLHDKLSKMPPQQALANQDFTDIDFLYQVCCFYFNERDKTLFLLRELLRIELDSNDLALDVCDQVRRLVKGCVAQMKDSLYPKLKDHLGKLYREKGIECPTQPIKNDAGNVYHVYVEGSTLQNVCLCLEKIHVARRQNTLIEMELVLEAMILLTEKDIEVVRFVEFQHFLSIATERNFSAPKRDVFLGSASSQDLEEFYDRFANNISFKYLMHFCNTLFGGYADGLLRRRFNGGENLIGPVHDQPGGIRAFVEKFLETEGLDDREHDSVVVAGFLWGIFLEFFHVYFDAFAYPDAAEQGQILSNDMKKSREALLKLQGKLEDFLLYEITDEMEKTIYHRVLHDTLNVLLLMTFNPTWHLFEWHDGSRDWDDMVSLFQIIFKDRPELCALFWKDWEEYHDLMNVGALMAQGQRPTMYPLRDFVKKIVEFSMFEPIHFFRIFSVLVSNSDEPDKSIDHVLKILDQQPRLLKIHETQISRLCVGKRINTEGAQLNHLMKKQLSLDALKKLSSGIDGWTLHQAHDMYHVQPQTTGEVKFIYEDDTYLVEWHQNCSWWAVLLHLISDTNGVYVPPPSASGEISQSGQDELRTKTAAFELLSALFSKQGNAIVHMSSQITSVFLLPFENSEEKFKLFSLLSNIGDPALLMNYYSKLSTAGYTVEGLKSNVQKTYNDLLATMPGLSTAGVNELKFFCMQLEASCDDDGLDHSKMAVCNIFTGSLVALITKVVPFFNRPPPIFLNHTRKVYSKLLCSAMRLLQGVCCFCPEPWPRSAVAQSIRKFTSSSVASSQGQESFLRTIEGILTRAKSLKSDVAGDPCHEIIERLCQLFGTILEHVEAPTTQIELTQLFKRIDINGDGKLSRQELTKALREIGYNATPNTIDEVFRLLELEERNYATYNDLLKYATTPHPESMDTTNEAHLVGGGIMTEQTSAERELRDLLSNMASQSYFSPSICEGFMSMALHFLYHTILEASLWLHAEKERWETSFACLDVFQGVLQRGKPSAKIGQSGGRRGGGERCSFFDFAYNNVIVMASNDGGRLVSVIAQLTALFGLKALIEVDHTRVPSTGLFPASFPLDFSFTSRSIPIEFSAFNAFKKLLQVNTKALTTLSAFIDNIQSRFLDVSPIRALCVTAEACVSPSSNPFATDTISFDCSYLAVLSGVLSYQDDLGAQELLDSLQVEILTMFSKIVLSQASGRDDGAPTFIDVLGARNLNCLSASLDAILKNHEKEQEKAHAAIDLLVVMGRAQPMTLAMILNNPKVVRRMPHDAPLPKDTMKSKLGLRLLDLLSKSEKLYVKYPLMLFKTLELIHVIWENASSNPFLGDIITLMVRHDFKPLVVSQSAVPQSFWSHVFYPLLSDRVDIGQDVEDALQQQLFVHLQHDDDKPRDLRAFIADEALEVSEEQTKRCCHLMMVHSMAFDLLAKERNGDLFDINSFSNKTGTEADQKTSEISSRHTTIFQVWLERYMNVKSGHQQAQHVVTRAQDLGISLSILELPASRSDDAPLRDAGRAVSPKLTLQTRELRGLTQGQFDKLIMSDLPDYNPKYDEEMEKIKAFVELERDIHYLNNLCSVADAQTALFRSWRRYVEVSVSEGASNRRKSKRSLAGAEGGGGVNSPAAPAVLDAGGLTPPLGMSPAAGIAETPGGGFEGDKRSFLVINKLIHRLDSDARSSQMMTMASVEKAELLLAMLSHQINIVSVRSADPKHSQVELREIEKMRLKVPKILELLAGGIGGGVGGGGGGGGGGGEGNHTKGITGIYKEMQGTAEYSSPPRKCSLLALAQWQNTKISLELPLLSTILLLLNVASHNVRKMDAMELSRLRHSSLTVFEFALNTLKQYVITGQGWSGVAYDVDVLPDEATREEAEIASVQRDSRRKAHTLVDVSLRLLKLSFPLPPHKHLSSSRLSVLDQDNWQTIFRHTQAGPTLVRLFRDLSDDAEEAVLLYHDYTFVPNHSFSGSRGKDRAEFPSAGGILAAAAAGPTKSRANAKLEEDNRKRKLQRTSEVSLYLTGLLDVLCGGIQAGQFIGEHLLAADLLQALSTASVFRVYQNQLLQTQPPSQAAALMGYSAENGEVSDISLCWQVTLRIIIAVVSRIASYSSINASLGELIISQVVTFVRTYPALLKIPLSTPIDCRFSIQQLHLIKLGMSMFVELNSRTPGWRALAHDLFAELVEDNRSLLRRLTHLLGDGDHQDSVFHQQELKENVLAVNMLEKSGESKLRSFRKLKFVASKIKGANAVVHTFSEAGQKHALAAGSPKMGPPLEIASAPLTQRHPAFNIGKKSVVDANYIDRREDHTMIGFLLDVEKAMVGALVPVTSFLIDATPDTHHAANSRLRVGERIYFQQRKQSSGELELVEAIIQKIGGGAGGGCGGFASLGKKQLEVVLINGTSQILSMENVTYCDQRPLIDFMSSRLLKRDEKSGSLRDMGQFIQHGVVTPHVPCTTAHLLSGIKFLTSKNTDQLFAVTKHEHLKHEMQLLCQQLAWLCVHNCVEAKKAPMEVSTADDFDEQLLELFKRIIPSKNGDEKICWCSTQIPATTCQHFVPDWFGDKAFRDFVAWLCKAGPRPEPLDSRDAVISSKKPKKNKWLE